MKLVVVSNRVARSKATEPMTGGLAAALLPVVENSGAIWVGSSGRVRDGFHKEPFAEIEALGCGALATLDLPAAHYGGYYEGFANSALWPALHSRSDLIRVSQEAVFSKWFLGGRKANYRASCTLDEAAHVATFREVLKESSWGVPPPALTVETTGQHGGAVT